MRREGGARVREGRAPRDAGVGAVAEEAHPSRVEWLRRRGVVHAVEPAAARRRNPRLLGGPPQRAAGHRHHGVQAALRGEALPAARDRLLRRQAGAPVEVIAFVLYICMFLEWNSWSCLPMR